MRTAGLLLVGLLAVACSSDAAPRAAASSSPSPLPDGRVRAVLGGVDLVLEVADTPQERAVGLMGRTSVPPGTGMAFVHHGLSEGRYWMYHVPIPLRAVFVRAGEVVSTVVMPPCRSEDASTCPTYGADGPYDTVVETAPETLPDVQPGDPFELQR